MGSIKQEDSGLWSIRYDLPTVKGGRKQKKEGGYRTKPMAAAELKKREADVLRGKLFYGGDVTLYEFADIWTERYIEKKLAPKTVKFYRTLVKNYIKPYFKKTKLSELRGDAIEEFYNYLAENTGLSPNSIHHVHKTLRALLNRAVRWGYIHTSPMVNVDPPGQTKTIIQYWEPDDIKENLKLFKGTQIEWHVNVALLTGLRLGEVCALNENTIDFKNNKFAIMETAQRQTGKGIIFKIPKTEASMADMPLTAETSRLLKARIIEIKNNRIKNADIYNKDYIGYLSVWEDGHIMDPTFISSLFTKIISDYNKNEDHKDKVKVITFHGLRHSCASWLISKGVDLKTVQAILRHSNYAITADTYAHIMMDNARKALEKISL